MFNLPIGAEIVLLSAISKLVVRITPSPIKIFWDLFSPGVKRPGFQADGKVLFSF
jgi:hypothetical protein